MQYFAIARLYMSKNHHLSHVMMLHFNFGCFLSWVAVMFKKVMSNIQAISKTHMSHVIYSCTFYGIQFRQKIKKMWHSK